MVISPPVLLDRRTVVSGAVTLVLLLLTQVYVSAPSVASVGGTKSLGLSEALGIGLVLVVAGLLLRPTWRRRLPPYGFYLMIAATTLAATWAVLWVVRLLMTGRRTISVTLIEFLFIAVAFALLILLRVLSARGVILGLLAFLTCIHAWALVMGMVADDTFRSIGLLGNINYYIGAVLVCLPFVLYWGMQQTQGWARYVAFGNVAVALCIVALSGSRFGGPAVVGELLIFFVMIDRRPLRRRFAMVGALLACVAVLGGAYMARNSQYMTDFGRTVNLSSIIYGTEPDTQKIEEEYRRQGEKDNADQINEQDRFTTPGDPDHDPPVEGVNILNHSRVKERAIAVAQENWLWGTGRHSVYFSGYGYHPPHNIGLEVLIHLGIFGVVPYFALALGGFGLTRKWRDPLVRAHLLGAAALLGFSMFQPLMSESLVCLLILWGLFAVTYLETSRQDAPLVAEGALAEGHDVASEGAVDGGAAPHARTPGASGHG